MSSPGVRRIHQHQPDDVAPARESFAAWLTRPLSLLRRAWPRQKPRAHRPHAHHDPGASLLIITCEACGYELHRPRLHTLGTHVIELRAVGWAVPVRVLRNGWAVRTAGDQLCPACREARGLPRQRAMEAAV